MKTYRTRIAELGLLLVFVLLSLALAEFVIRIAIPDSERHFVLPPNQQITLEPNAEELKGVSDTSNYLTSSHGIRGYEFGEDGSEYRILIFGGSTTQNMYLDQTETWTLKLASMLNEITSTTTWSGDVGRSGHSARSHVLQIRNLLPELPELDAIIVLVGVNDMTIALRQGENYEKPIPLSDPVALQEQTLGAFIQLPGPSHLQKTQYLYGDVPFYKRLALYQLLSQAKTSMVAATRNTEQDRFGTIYADWRSKRKNASEIIDVAPPLEEALDVYRSYLTSIVAAANDNDVRLILLTQPYLWKPSMSDEEQRTLWMGGQGDFQFESGAAYYSTRVLADSLDRYNEATLEICQLSGTECFDLAAALPKSLDMFFDDVHFTERGAHEVAVLVSDYLAGRAPFVESK